MRQKREKNEKKSIFLVSGMISFEVMNSNQSSMTDRQTDSLPDVQCTFSLLSLRSALVMSHVDRLDRLWCCSAEVLSSTQCILHTHELLYPRGGLRVPLSHSSILREERAGQ